MKKASIFVLLVLSITVSLTPVYGELVNGDFEQDLTGWTQFGTQSTYASGGTTTSGDDDPDYELFLTRSLLDGNAWVSQMCDVTTSTRISFKAKLSGQRKFPTEMGQAWAMADLSFRDANSNEVAALIWVSSQAGVPGSDASARWYGVDSTSWNEYDFIVGDKIAADLPSVDRSQIRKVVVKFHVMGTGLGANASVYADDVTISPPTLYTLAVTSGSGSGPYASGQQVQISADAPVNGKAFDKWTGDTQYVDSVFSSTTTVTMLAQTITLTATYYKVNSVLGAFGGSPNSGIYTNIWTPGNNYGWNPAGNNLTYPNLAGGGKIVGSLGAGATKTLGVRENGSAADTFGYEFGTGTSAIGDKSAFVGMVDFGGSATLTNLFLQYASTGLAGSFDTTARVVIVQSGVYKISDADLLPISAPDTGSRSLTAAELLSMKWVTWNPTGTEAEYVLVDTSGGSMLANLDNVSAAGVWYGRTQTNLVANVAFGYGSVNGIVAAGFYGPGTYYTYTTNSGAITITGYIGSGGDVTIPDKINGFPVTSIGDRAFYGCSGLTSVTIPNSVTSIGTEAFAVCNMTSVTIPDSVTSIGVSAFYSCLSLTNAIIGKSVASIGDSPFRGCYGLLAITVNYSNSFYISVNGVLFNKSQTKLIQCPARKAGSYTIPGGVTNIGTSAFVGCTSLTSVTIPDSISSIGEEAFWNCSGLTSVTIPNSITTIGDYAFSWCTSLTGVYFKGNAPYVGSQVFNYAGNVTVYRLATATGWPTVPNLWAGCPTALWNPADSGVLCVAVQALNGSYQTNAIVTLYDNGWTPISTKTTDASGVASWDGLGAGTYIAEAYFYNATHDTNEFWGGITNITVMEGWTTGVTIQRHMPYASDFRIYSGSTDVTGESVPVGTPLTIKLWIYNPGTAGLNVKSLIWLDRTNAPGTDFSQTSSPIFAAATTTVTQTFSYTASSTGVYFRTLQIQTDINNYQTTDAWGWDSVVTAISAPGEFNLTSPTANETGVSPTPTFRWESASGATGYRFEIKDQWGLWSRGVLVGNTTTFPYDETLTYGQDLYWRVFATNIVGETRSIDDWRKFTVQPLMPVNVAGRWLYTRTAFNRTVTNAIRFARIELYDNEPSPLDPALIAVTNTDEDGFFQFSDVPNNDGPLEGGVDLFCRVYTDYGLDPTKCARVGTYTYWPPVNDCSAYSENSSIIGNCTGGTVDFGSIVIADNMAFDIYDDAVTEYNFFKNSSPSHANSKIYIFYPDNTPLGLLDSALKTWNGDTPGSYFEPQWNFIGIRESVLGLSTVFHEYAHAMMRNLYDGTLPSGANDPASHYYSIESNPEFALTEGWAAFCGGFFAQQKIQARWDKDLPRLGFEDQWKGVAGASSGATDPAKHYADLDDTQGPLGYECDGASVEGSVAEVFWDIVDGGAADDDAITSDFNSIMATLSQFHPQNIFDFKLWYLQLYPDRQNALQDVYQVAKIERATDTMAPQPVTALRADYITNGVYLSWSPVSGAEVNGYVCFKTKGIPRKMKEPLPQSRFSIGEWEYAYESYDNHHVVYVGADTGFLDTNILSGTQYFYTVYAYDTAHNYSEGALVKVSRKETDKVKIILDTDLASDCDDLGAIAVLHQLANQGRAEILGMVCDVSDNDSPLCLSAINTYYGHPNIPIGCVKDQYVSPCLTRPIDAIYFAGLNRYTATITSDTNLYPRNLATWDSVPDALDVYRDILRANSNVTIVSIGSLYHLDRLLTAEPNLVRSSVDKLVIMGGNYPLSSSAFPDYNFTLWVDAAVRIAENWPTPIVFTGLGSDVITGTALFDDLKVSDNSPIRVGYDLGTRGPRFDTMFSRPLVSPHTRPSWDQIAVLYAVEGVSSNFVESANGVNTITSVPYNNLILPFPYNMTVNIQGAYNAFSNDIGGNHWYLQMRDVNATNELAAYIESLMAGPINVVFDSDGDGIPDWWEVVHFGNSTNANPSAICSNGFNTVRQAYIAGLDPNDPNAAFLTSILPGRVLQWNVTSGRVYDVYWTTNLMNSFQPLATNIVWPQDCFTNSTDVPCGFYKIDVKLAP